MEGWERPGRMGLGLPSLCAEKRGHWEFSSKPELPSEFPYPSKLE